MNPTLGQRRATPDAGRKNPTGQRSGSNGSVWKLLLLIYKSGIYWWGKKSYRKISMTLTQTICPNRLALRTNKQAAGSAKVGTLASVFEKLATKHKPKPKQKLLWCKSTVHIVTLNVWTLKRICLLPELTASAAEHNIDIVYTQEHWYYHSEEEIKYNDIGNGWTFITTASSWK